MDIKESTVPDSQTPTERRRQFIKSFEAKSIRSRSLLTQISDDLTNIFGSTSFLILNAVFFTQWIVINMGWIKGLVPWDPYPFGLLTMIVSLEAIFLAIFVLVAQNRASAVSSIREEVHLQVNLIAEEEITKVLEVLAEIRQHVGIKREDKELENMLKRIDTNYIEQRIVDQLARANKPLTDKLVKRPIEAVKNIVQTDKS